MNTNKISKYRSAVMGFAILWIMAYHSGVSLSFLPIFATAADNFRGVGYGGVDIFLFLSGFGLYRSLSQNPDQLSFYKRRLYRLLPAYLPVLAVWLFLNRSRISLSSLPRVILTNLTGTAFWRSPGLSFNWYMLALFSFYFISPFFFRAMKRPRGVGWIIAATLVLDVCFYGNSVMIAISRFTIFAMGMAWGRWTAEGEKENLPLELLTYVLGGFSYWLLQILRKSLSSKFLWNSGLYWYPFIFIAPALIFLLCRIFSRTEHRAPWLLRFFELAGNCSLEIYLIHIVAFDYIHLKSRKVWLCIYAVMILCGYIYHTILARLTSWRPSIPHLAKLEQKIQINRQSDPKIIYIQFLRIIAAFLVIVNHTISQVFTSRISGPTWLCSVTYIFICKPAVPLFLFIMGALLLGKEDTPKKTRSRLLRIFVVFIVSSLCYYVYYALRKGDPLSITKFLLDLPKIQVTNAFWYLYLYLALLCMLPILQRFAKALDKQHLEYFLFFSLGVAGTAPLITIFYPDFKLSGSFTAGLIGVYIGQVFLGYYIEQYVPMTKQVFWGALCSFAVLIAFQVGGTYLFYQRNPKSYMALDNRTLITITTTAAALYICVKYLFVKHPPSSLLAEAICRLGSLTFGIYLLADMVRSQSTPFYAALSGRIHPLAAIVLWESFIFTVCALATAGLRLIPPLRKWL